MVNNWRLTLNVTFGPKRQSYHFLQFKSLNSGRLNKHPQYFILNNQGFIKPKVQASNCMDGYPYIFENLLFNFKKCHSIETRAHFEQMSQFWKRHALRTCCVLEQRRTFSTYRVLKQKHTFSACRVLEQRQALSAFHSFEKRHA